MNELLILLRGELGILGLCATRLTGLIIAAPLGWDQAPVRARGALVLVVALAVHSVHPRLLAAQDLGVWDWWLLVWTEFLLGLGMGFVVRVTVGSAEIAGEAIASSMGLGAAQMFDPQNGAQSTVMTRIFRLLAISLALAIGAHRVLLGSVLDSFRAVPVGLIHDPGAAAPTLLGLVANSIACGARIAIPVIALLFVTQVALAFISRAAPAMQIFAVGFAVTLGVGVFALVLTLPDTAREMLVQLSYVGHQVEMVASRMGRLP